MWLRLRQSRSANGVCASIPCGVFRSQVNLGWRSFATRWARSGTRHRVAADRDECKMIDLRVGDSGAFFETPFHAYRPDDGYVSPLRGDILRMLDAKKNPLWLSGNPFRFWTAHRHGRPIGRIVAHVHGQSNTRHGTNRAQFGFFDCADDAEAASALLNAATEFARQAGKTE